jgi:flagellar hook-associated protein 1 FlgK
MSILGILDISKSALMASQAALSVTSNNIANANTPGYSKEDIILQIATPVESSSGIVGRGVTVAGIRRSYDKFLQSQLQDQGQNQGSSSALDQTWSQIELLFNDMQGFGLSSALSDYFNAWQDVASAPTSLPQRSALLQKANTLVTKARNMESGILDTLKSASEGISDAVQQVNTLATEIASLNGQISLQEAGAGGMEKANDLRDQRDTKLNDLAKLVGFSTYEDPNGSLTITVGMRNLVSGGRTNQLTNATNSDGNQTLTLDGINVTSYISKGQIGGLIAAQTDIQTNLLTPFRKLIASVTQQVNIGHEAGFGLDGSTNNPFFAPLQITASGNSAGAVITVPPASITQSALTLDEYNITIDTTGLNYTVTNKATGAIFSAGVYTSGNPIALPGMNAVITGAVAAGNVFSVSPLTSAISNFGVAVTDPRKIAASSTALGVPGDNGNALSLSQLSNTAMINLGSLTFSDYYGGLVSKVGTEKKTASDGLTFDNSLLTELQSRRDSVSGVSLDEEAANLMRFQRSYEAGARMISVADELMKTILNL